nr:collectrin [Vulpes vulpes]
MDGSVANTASKYWTKGGQLICLDLRCARLNETKKSLMRTNQKLLWFRKRPSLGEAGMLISHVLLCNVTQRVSFWFVVTDPSKNHTLPAVEIESAIRMNRNRINNAFFLNDQTLEFLKIPTTLAPPTDPPVPIWIIIFGVIFCIVIVAVVLLILSGIRQRRRKSKEPSEADDTEDKCENTITIENGIPCDPLDTKGGHINDAFMTEDERLTPL